MHASENYLETHSDAVRGDVHFHGEEGNTSWIKSTIEVELGATVSKSGGSSGRCR